MWKVYVLLSIEYQKTYIGSTNNLARRLEEHNKGKERFTSIYKPWIPIYIEFYPNEKEARDREKELKTSSGRRYLKKVINNIIEKWTGSSTGPPCQAEACLQRGRLEHRSLCGKFMYC